jgi:serine/threonine protein kinase
MSGNTSLTTIDDKYVLGQILGEGTYGIVYKATDRTSK